MVSLKRMLRDYTEADSLNGWLAVWCFVDDHVFLTKTGEIGLVYRLAGVDYEGCDQRQRRQVVHRFESALRLTGYRLYQYILKRRVERFPDATCANPIAAAAIQQRHDYLNQRRDDLYELDLYLILMSDGVRATSTSTQLGKFLRDVLCDPKRAFREYLSSSAVTTMLEAELSASVAKLRSTAATLEVQLADTVRPTRLPKRDAYLFLRQLLNPAAHKAKQPLTYDTHLDFFASDSLVRCEDDHLVLDQRCVRVLTMKEPPTQTYAHILEQLHAVDGEFNACLEYRLPAGCDGTEGHPDAAPALF